MPEAAEFLNGFGLVRGAQFGGYILDNAISTHESVKRYQEYRYNITLTFRRLGSGTYDDFFHTVMNKISQQPIIYGIRNPYHCIIDPPQNGDIIQDYQEHIIFKLIGHSYRVN